MCVIVYKPKNTELPIDNLLDCALFNMDGFGYMFWNGESIQIEKGFFDVYDMIKCLMRDVGKQNACIMHFRIATAGIVNSDNCHPYPISNNIKELTSDSINCGMAFCHNGILRSTLFDKIDLVKYSDTLLFIKDTLSKLSSESMKIILPMIAKLSHSKFALMDNEQIILYGDFYKVDDCYYSNKSWCYSMIVKSSNINDDLFCEWCEISLYTKEEVQSGLCQDCLKYVDEAEEYYDFTTPDINDNIIYCDYCGIEVDRSTKYKDFILCDDCSSNIAISSSTMYRESSL